MLRFIALLAATLFCGVCNALTVYSASYNADRTILPNSTEIGLLGESQLGLTSCEQSTSPVENDIKTAVTALADKPYIVLNIECWTFPLTSGSESTRDSSRDKWLQVLAWAKQAAPNAVIGAWSVPGNPWNPYRNNSAPAGDTQANYEAIWGTELADLVQAQDALFPEYYIYYHDRGQWGPMTEWYVNLVRSVNPDVIVLPFLHEHLWGSIYAPIAPGALAFICDFHYVLRASQDYTNGAVIWLSTADVAFDTSEEWYIEIQAWIAGSGQRVCPTGGYTFKSKIRKR